MSRPFQIIQNKAKPIKNATRFVVLIGLVSLFGDMTYEAARSINGPFLAFLGANAMTVGFVAGSGELIGYLLRLFSGYLSDKTQKYWVITLVGYSINLIAVPCLALAGNWPAASALMILERLGKAIRTPARDAMLANASQSMGRGWGFALHEALDQIGAVTGPLIVAAVFYFTGKFSAGYAVLAIPALMALALLLTAKFLYPRPQDLEIKIHKIAPEGFLRRYWIYVLAVALVAAGYADFPLIAYHWKKTALFPTAWIPVFYSVAMGVDALSALFFGRLFDRRGLSVLMTVSFISAFFAPFVFSHSFAGAIFGMALWGVGMGTQESIMRAAVSEMAPKEKRGTAFGIFNTGYGVAWFLGSALMGFLYDRSLFLVIIFSMSMQFLSIPLFWLISRKERPS